ncbi:hypothetical protein EIH08_08940 [Chryseobacterium taklimakanense]|uniref:Uncharacterized protein n=1 Tax=Chryseobacterium taklimakanense TaxID=536441 RepID=A0A3G8WMG2_9FLAO|nr:hypothetical protein EIH08_08940 [Chryseobacterium taklimakanense]
MEAGQPRFWQYLVAAGILVVIVLKVYFPQLLFSSCRPKMLCRQTCRHNFEVNLICLKSAKYDCQSQI